MGHGAPLLSIPPARPLVVTGPLAGLLHLLPLLGGLGELPILPDRESLNEGYQDIEEEEDAAGDSGIAGFLRLVYEVEPQYEAWDGEEG